MKSSGIGCEKYDVERKATNVEWKRNVCEARKEGWLCVKNDAALMTRGESSCISSLILGLDLVRGGRGHELNIK